MYLNENWLFASLDPDSDVTTGVTTLMFTTEEVAETPAAVATAMSPFEPALRLSAVMLKGGDWLEPTGELLSKKDTFVTVPLLTLALAEILTFAGAAKTAFGAGLVMLTVGVGGGAAAGVVRV